MTISLKYVSENSFPAASLMFMNLDSRSFFSEKSSDFLSLMTLYAKSLITETVLFNFCSVEDMKGNDCHCQNILALSITITHFWKNRFVIYSCVSSNALLNGVSKKVI